MPQVRRCRSFRLMFSRLISQTRSGSGAADEAAVARNLPDQAFVAAEMTGCSD